MFRAVSLPLEGKACGRPRYDLDKRNAPLVRNRAMVDMSDSVLVLWDGKSRGIKSTIDYANKTGKPINVVIV